MFGYGGYGMWNGFGMMIFGLFCILIIGAIILFLIKPFQHSVNSTSNKIAPTNNDAIEIAKSRYASGEITFDEYQEIIKSINR